MGLGFCLALGVRAIGVRVPFSARSFIGVRVIGVRVKVIGGRVLFSDRS